MGWQDAPLVEEEQGPAWAKAPIYGGPETPVSDYATSIAHGLARGTAGLVGIPGDVQALTRWASSKLPSWMSGLGASPLGSINLPTSSDVVDFTQRNLIGPPPQTTTPGSQFAGNVAAYAPSALLGGPEGLMGRLGVSLLSGAGAEGARVAGLPVGAQIAAGLAPGLGVSAGRAIGSIPSQFVQRAVEGVPESRWAEAAQLQKAAPGLGLQLMGQEALAPEVGGGDLGTLASTIGAMSKGGALRQAVEQRPGQLLPAMKGVSALIGPQAEAPEVLANVKDTAQNAINSLDAARRTGTAGLYAAANPVQIPPNVVTGIIGKVDDALAGAPQGSTLKRGLQQLRQQLVTEDGSPQTLTSALSTTYKELRDKLGAPTGVGDAGSLRSYKGTLAPINRSIQDALLENNPWYKAATDKYQALSAPLTQLAGTPDNPSLISKIADAGSNTELQKLLLSPKNVSPQTVSTVAGLFRDQGRLEDLGAWLRHYSDAAIDEAAQNLQSGKNPAMGANWVKAIYGRPEQQKIFDTYLNELDPTGGALRGFQKGMQILERTAKTPGMGSPTAGRLFTADELSNGVGPMAAGVAAGALGGMVGLPTAEMAGGYLIASGIRGYIQRQALQMGAKQIAQAFTDPDSVGKLRALARKDPQSSAALTSVLAILSGRGAQQEQ